MLSRMTDTATKETTMTTQLADQATQIWRQHQALLVLTAGLLALALVLTGGWLFYRSRERSKTVSTLAAVVVMAWTSEGLLHVALTKFHMPAGFASVTFFVFEAMLVACWLKAEEHRAAKGVPGPAGQYAFVIGAAQGVVASFGAHDVGEVVLRLLLPALSIGLAWIFLVAERDTDTDEMKAERARRAADREATWVHTPRTVAVKVGLMKPGNVTTTDAQREHQIARMVVAADTIASGGRGVERARRTLRRLTRTADKAMIEAVAARVRHAVDAEALMVPAVKVPVEPAAPASAEVPVHVPVEVPATPSAHRSGGGSTRKSTRKKPEPRPRRSAEETRKLATELKLADPSLTQEQIAAQLRISDRRLREVLAEPAKTNGHAQPDLLPTGSNS